MKHFYALSAVFCLWAIAAYAFVMPTRPDAEYILENIPLGEVNLPSKLIKIPYPMIQDGYMGRADTKSIPKALELGKNEIALTFDDGPSPHTPKVLEALRKAGNVKATFFLVGHNVKSYPEMVIKILKDGHSIGNHTWNHKALPKLSADQAYNEIATTDALLKRIVADYNANHPTEEPLVIQPFFRFPEGAGAFDKNITNLLAKKEFGFANFYWSMSVHDSRSDDPNIIFQIAVKDMLNKYNNGVILLHETRPWTREMLPWFLQVLAQRKYTTVYYQADQQP